MTLFAAKIAISDESTIILPDSFDIRAGKHPPPEFIVSRKFDGNAASTYGDDVWDWSSYCSTRSLSFYFSDWCGKEISPEQRLIVDQAKFLLFALIWFRNGSALSSGSVTGYYRLLITLAIFCENHALLPIEVLKTKSAIKQFAKSIPPGLCVLLVSLISQCRQSGDELLGFIPTPHKNLSDLLRLIDRYKKSLKQHPPIPTGIYEHLLETILDEVLEISLIIDNFLLFASRCVDQRGYGRSERHQIFIDQTRQPQDFQHNFEQAANELKLTSFFQSRNFDFNVKSITSAISYILTVCQYVIISFSGMRIGESLLLRKGCAITETRAGKTRYLLNGFTQKLNRGIPKKTKWITSAESHKAVAIAEKVSTALHAAHAQLTGAKCSDVQPLFTSPAYFRLGGGRLPQHAREALATFEAPLRQKMYLWDKACAKIEEQDILELEAIDPFRAWRSEERFQIGKRWHLTAHQLRRSLALYASRSGIVALPSLRRQLDHITEAMSLYYARGSQFAVDFVEENSNDFVAEYQEAQPLSKALTYIRDVLESSEPLFGAHGVWVDRRMRSKDEPPLFDREETINLFKRGILSYVSTPLGGCTSTQRCDSRALAKLTSCLSCKSLAGKRSKLVQVITVHKSFLADLALNSVDAKITAQQLDMFQETLSKIDLKGVTL